MTPERLAEIRGLLARELRDWPEVDELLAEVEALRAQNEKMKIALEHAVYRNHESSPTSCAGCAGIDKALERP